MNSRFAIVLVAYASLLLFGLSDNIRGPLFSEILTTYNIRDSQGSWFFSFSSAATIFGAGMCAWWVFRLGEIRTLRFSIFLLGISQVLISFSSSFYFLLATKILFGFALGLLGVVQNILVVQASPEKYKNKILSGLHSMYAAASLLAPLMINALISVWHSSLNETELWRRIFQVTAVCSFLLLLLTFMKKDWQIPKELQAQSHKNTIESRAKQIYFALALSCYVGAEVLISSRIALYMRKEYAATLAESSWYTAGFFVCLFVGRLLFTVWTPKMTAQKQLLISLALSTLLMISGLAIHPVLLAATGFAMAPFYPLMMFWAGEIFSKSLAAAISLAVSFSGITVLVMHIVLGLVSDWPGIRYGFMIGPSLCLVAIGMLFSYEKIFRQLPPEIRR